MAFYFLDYQYLFHFWGTDIGPVLVKNKVPIFCLNQVSSTLLRQSTENHVCFKKDTLSHLKGYLVFDRKRLEPRVLSWQSHKGCDLDSFVMYIPGSKFKEFFSNVSRDILDSVFYYFRETIWCHHFPHLHNTKTTISLKRKR